MAAGYSPVPVLESLSSPPEAFGGEVHEEAAPAGLPAPIRQSHWLQTALLLMADIVGAGVLSLSGAVRRMGSYTGLVLLGLFIPLNVVTGLMLWKVRYGLRDIRAGDVPSSTYGELFDTLFGRSHWLSYAAYFTVYLYIFLACADYFLVLAKSIQEAVFTVDLCRPVAGALGACVLVFGNQLRTLDGVSFVSIFGSATILMVLAICAGTIVTGKSSDELHDDEKSGGDLLSLTPTVGAFLFSSGGQKIYPEMMAEMRNVGHFPRALLLASTCMTCLYFGICVISYVVLADRTPDYILDVLPYNFWRTTANVLLFAHMVVAYTLNQQILTRAIHARLSPSRVNLISRDQQAETEAASSNGKDWDMALVGKPLLSSYSEYDKGRIEWAALTTLLMITCFLVAESIPRFTDFVDLLGTAFASNLSFTMPVLMYYQYVKLKGRPLSRVETVACAFYIVIAVYFTFVGTSAVLVQIVRHDKSSNPPWSCLCVSESCAAEDSR
mmetsp:Transcript_2973/g.12041  ORF Transcript_2973/g.12041 Transcript_2973/m.12041 type:complete len:497 (-) Transcript_2973:28-1518(-)|eukprot:scaffold470_cov257-Pinguiococcus_pyrenoidosus.AAC.23